MTRSSRRRVAIVSQLPPPVHGSTLMTALLVDALGVENDVRLLDRRYSRDVGEVGSFRLRKVLSLASFLARACGLGSTWRPDVAVFFLTSRGISFVSDALCIAVLRAFRVPLVHYIHTAGYRALSDRGAVWNFAVTRALRSATVVVTLGDSLVGDISWATGVERITTIRNIPPSRPPEDLPARGRKVLFLSNFLPEKGAGFFLNVAEELGASRNDVQFVLAGAPADRSFFEHVVARASASPLGDRIRVLGPVQGRDKWDLLASSEVLAFPSTYPLEAQPLVILEALAVGTCVVATDMGGIRDLARDNDRMRVVAYELEAFVEAVDSMLGVARTGQDFDWDADFERFSCQWRAVLGRVGVDL